MSVARDSRTAWLFRPVDASSVGAFRIMFGLIMVVEVYRYFALHRIRPAYITPDFHFKYLFFEWVQPWPGLGMFIHFAALGLLAALITAGLFYRLSAVLFFLAFSYVFLIDQARHLNHFYLVSLIAFLMCFVDANRWLSLDLKLLHRHAPATIPFWQLFLLRAQVFIVYFYAGVAKLNPDWLLRGEPVRGWLDGPLEPLRSGWVVGAIAWGAMLFDLSIGFLLIWRRTRPIGMVLALLFHLGNCYLHRIGIFPYFAFALTLLFLEPDWPRTLLRKLTSSSPVEADHETPPAPMRAPWVVPFLATYLAAQCLVPLRHWLYPGDVNWTEEGHRFSWRMKLRSKRSRMRVTVRDPASGREWHVDPEHHLSDDQAEEMEGRPDMVLQFAHLLRDHYRDYYGVSSPEVFIRDVCTLNRRPGRDLIRPDVNLAIVPRSLGPATWIIRQPAAAPVGDERAPRYPPLRLESEPRAPD